MSEEFNWCGPSSVPLAPCPICGSEAELWERVDSNDNGKAVKAVSCTHNHQLGSIEEGCPLYMPPEEFYRATRREAVRVWNSFVEASALAKVRQAIEKYYLALDKREHGGKAQDLAFNEIQQELGMYWQQGEMLKKAELDKK